MPVSGDGRDSGDVYSSLVSFQGEERKLRIGIKPTYVPVFPDLWNLPELIISREVPKSDSIARGLKRGSR
jgi:hypothetical protein